MLTTIVRSSGINQHSLVRSTFCGFKWVCRMNSAVLPACVFWFLFKKKKFSRLQRRMGTNYIGIYGFEINCLLCLLFLLC
ncbi:hypothetical protein BKA61DRAFT_598906 [Leptodontidium sp. MPI-SDFR-AT-0119]|nr:hypothetical protein BKA61DRAFT_598906 [Leptodontidium sp. MPI-SDFR-AT-0119]